MKQRQKESIWTWLVGGVGIGAMLLLAGTFALVLRGATTSVATASPPPSASPAVTNTPFSDLPPDRQTVEAILQQTRFAVTIPAQTEIPSYDPPTPIPVTPEPWDWGSGIIQSGDAPFAGMQYSISNRWYGMVNGLRAVVYAGGVRDNPGVSSDVSKGVVIVITASPQGEYPPEFYLPSANSGLFTIVSEDDLRLILDTPSGQKFYFDVPSRQFLDSLTATPPPTVTVIPSPTLIPPPTAYPLSTSSP